MDANTPRRLSRPQRGDRKGRLENYMFVLGGHLNTLWEWS